MRKLELAFQKYVPGEVEVLSNDPQHMEWVLSVLVGDNAFELKKANKVQCESDPDGLFHAEPNFPFLTDEELFVISKMTAAYWAGYFNQTGFSLYGYAKKKRGLNVAWKNISDYQVDGAVKIVGRLNKALPRECAVSVTDDITCFSGIPRTKGGKGYLPKFETLEREVLYAALYAYYKGLRHRNNLYLWAGPMLKGELT